MDPHRPTRPSRNLLLALAAGLIFAACGGDSTAPAAHEPPLLVHTGSLDEGGDSALILGTLVLEEDCLFIDDSGRRFPIVWPNGTTWDDESQTIALNDGQTVAIGQSLTGGGGYPNVEALEALVGPEAAMLAAACVDNEFSEVAVLNNTTDPLTFEASTSESD